VLSLFHKVPPGCFDPLERAPEGGGEACFNQRVVELSPVGPTRSEERQ